MAQRIAYVTGGMGGIGTAICQRLSKGGFKVIADCGPNSPRKDRWIGEQKALGYEFIASEGNVSDWESTKAAFEKVRPSVGWSEGFGVALYPVGFFLAVRMVGPAS